MKYTIAEEAQIVASIGDNTTIYQKINRIISSDRRTYEVNKIQRINNRNGSTN